MLFNSFEFLAFFILVTSLYFILPHSFRWWMLLLASCYFYMAFVPVYILILGFTIVIDYFAGLLIERNNGKRRKFFLVISILANVGILAVFKYYNFLNENISFLLTNLGTTNPIPYLTILLPIGLSFHTFQAMSYTIEVYRGTQKAERNIGIYALYVMYYPQLVAGPIERPQNVLYQFYKKQHFDYERVVSGLILMVWGLFKKVVIADRLALFVNPVYSNPDQHIGISIITSTFYFAIQIYCDFSGYTDIAIGASKVMGIDLMENFKQPYLSTNISEFWTRWHISLSTWFKDYLYIPLGGNRGTKLRWYFNLFIVFMVSGIWHGASWNFVVWGALHGLFLIIYNQFGKKVSFGRFGNFFLTISCVCFAWIFFRAPDFQTSIKLISKLFVGWDIFFKEFINGFHVIKYFLVGNLLSEFILSIILILFLLTIEVLQRKVGSLRERLRTLPFVARWFCYYAAIGIILFLGVYEESSFIYFQF